MKKREFAKELLSKAQKAPSQKEAAKILQVVPLMVNDVLRRNGLDVPNWVALYHDRKRASQRTPERKREQARINAKKRYDANPEKIRAVARAWRQKSYGERNTNMEARARWLWKSARLRSLKKQIPFSLDRDRIVKILERGVCEVTGIPFVFSYEKTPWAPSLDRTDSSKGYTDDNVKVVVYLYNVAKSEFAHEDVVRLATEVLACKNA